MTVPHISHLFSCSLHFSHRNLNKFFPYLFNSPSFFPFFLSLVNILSLYFILLSFNISPPLPPPTSTIFILFLTFLFININLHCFISVIYIYLVIQLIIIILLVFSLSISFSLLPPPCLSFLLSFSYCPFLPFSSSPFLSFSFSF